MNIRFDYCEYGLEGKQEKYFSGVTVEYEVLDKDKKVLTGEYKNPKHYKPDMLKEEIEEYLKESIVGNDSGQN